MKLSPTHPPTTLADPLTGVLQGTGYRGVQDTGYRGIKLLSHLTRWHKAQSNILTKTDKCDNVEIVEAIKNKK